MGGAVRSIGKGISKAVGGVSSAIGGIGKAIFGDQESEAQKTATDISKKSWNKGNKGYDEAYDQYKSYRDKADQAWNSDFGANGQDYANKSRAYGTQTAADSMGRASQGAQAQTIASARAAGLGEGASALMGGQSAQNVWSNYDNAVQQGIGNYQIAAQNYQAGLQGRMGSEQANMNINAGLMGSSMQAANAAAANSTSQYQQNMNIIGGLTGGIAAGLSLSDEREKEDIAPNYSEELYKYIQGKKDGTRGTDK